MMLHQYLYQSLYHPSLFSHYHTKISVNLMENATLLHCRIGRILFRHQVMRKPLCTHSTTTYYEYNRFSRSVTSVGGKMTANAGKLRGILGAMELGRRNLTADGPVSYA